MKKLMVLVLIVTILSACGNNEETKNKASKKTIEPIEANLSVPEKVDTGENVTLSVTITQASNSVDDANEVEFEVWKDGAKEGSKIVKTQYQGKGVYSSETTFTENGTYHVQSHVTARGMHTMPKTQIQVGTPNESSAANKQDNSQTADDNHHHSNTTIDFQLPNLIETNKSAVYTVKVNHESKPLEHALVRLEVWKDGSDKHNYVNLIESDKGTYLADMAFEDKGIYHITVHVEKNEIHTHKEFKVEVK